MTIAGGASYSYDGDGRRVKKVTGGATLKTTVFVYNAMGQLVAEYDDFEQQGTGGTSYLTSDSLGTPRVITGTEINDSTGGVKARHDYLPFGEEIGQVGGRTEGQKYVVDNVKQKFTGYERDDETGLDYARARYYSNTQGRFTSPDPLFASGKPPLPQSWNRYIEGIEALHMMRKGQVKRLDGRDSAAAGEVRREPLRSRCLTNSPDDLYSAQRISRNTTETHAKTVFIKVGGKEDVVEVFSNYYKVPGRKTK